MNRNEYFLVMKDLASEYCYVHSMVKKSQVTAALASLIVMFGRKRGNPIKRIHTDNGYEFLNNSNKLLFLK